MGGFQGVLGAFGTVAELEQALVNQGLSIEAARSAAQSASASGGAALAKAGTPATSGGGGLFSSLLSGAASALGNTDLTDLVRAGAAIYTGGASEAYFQGADAAGLTKKT